MLVKIQILILLFLCAISGKIYLHEDFEGGRTVTASKIRPGQKNIELTINRKLDEWPHANGSGIIEPDFLPASDSFRYAKREKNVLKGVDGIFHSHAENVNIQTGNAPTFYNFHNLSSSSLRKIIYAKRTQSLFGFYSLKTEFFSDSIVSLALEIPLDLVKKKDIFFRAYAAFSPDIFKNNNLELLLFTVNLGKITVQSIYLTKEADVDFGYLTLKFLYNERGTITYQRETNNKVRILPGKKYCIEYHLSRGDSMSGMAELLVNGELQVLQSAVYFQVSSENQYFFKLGKRQRKKIKGSYLLDEMIFSDTRPGIIPEKPELIYKDKNLVMDMISDYSKSAVQKSQWQINYTNTWLMPFYNILISGENM
ncbi:MAG: hypothetical protein ABIA63_03230, partial [bacterium]